MNTIANVMRLVAFTCLFCVLSVRAEYKDIVGTKHIPNEDGTTNITTVRLRCYVSSYSNATLSDEKLFSNDTRHPTLINPQTNDMRRSSFPKKGRVAAKLEMAKSDALKGHPTILTLANNSDMIVVGTIETLLLAPGLQPFHIGEEEIGQLFVVKINEVVAAIAPSTSYADTLSSSHNCSNVVYLIDIPLGFVCGTTGVDSFANRKNVFYTPGATYLLWLKAYPMDTKDAKRYDIEGECIFKPLYSGNASVLLSNANELPTVMNRPESAVLYRNNDAILYKMYNATNTTAILKAAKAIATGMHYDSDNAGRLRAIELCDESLGIGLSNNYDEIQWGRFRTIDKKLP